MIHNVIRSSIYFVVCVAFQVLVLNNIYLFRVATPFLYLYFLLKIPAGTSRSYILILSFLTGLLVGSFSNTAGIHAAACTLAGFMRSSLIRLYMGKDIPTGAIPSFREFGYRGFFKYVFTFVFIHHTVLYLLESLALFDPLYLTLRIAASILITVTLVCSVEAFNPGTNKE